MEKYWKGISNPIFLKFPNGVQQEIFWVESNGDIWFHKNWESFAKFLKYGYLLTFKFIGGSYFKVKIFGANTLEINYSNIKSVDDGAEATKEVHESDEVSDEVEIPKQATRNGKRKVSMDFDTTQHKFSGEFSLFILVEITHLLDLALSVTLFFENKSLVFIEISTFTF